jgi:hypothetical protein
MLEMRSLPIMLACFVTGSLASATRGESQTICEKLAVTPALARSLADTLNRRSNKSVPPIDADIQVANVPVRLPGGCVNVVTLSWCDGFEGGIVIQSVTDGKAAIQGLLDYPGARNPMPAGAGRVLFTYPTERGSGQIAERTAVLCSLAEDVWVVCADILTRQEVTGTGYPPSDSLAKGVALRMRSRVAVLRDTLVVTSDVTIRRYGTQSPTRRTLVAKHPLP